MDLVQFFGRFHVLVLHLPIGILLLVALMEMTAYVKKSIRHPILNTIWFWGAVSAIAACVLGWMLSQGEGYNSEAVFIHRTFGILTAVIAITLWLYFSFINQSPGKVTVSLSLFQLVLLFSTGHYGANMTHGETYLVEHAPNVVRSLAGLPPHAEPRPPITSLAQADVYLDVISPMINKRCTSCHNDSKQKGRLNLVSYDSMLKGGKSGKAIVAGDLDASELYQRITLDDHDKKFMPAEGKTPFTDEQTKAIAWWIKSGAPAQGTVASFTQNKDDKTLLAQLLGLSSNGFNLPSIAQITERQHQALSQAGFVIKQVSQKHHYIELDYSTANKPVDEQTLSALNAVSAHIVAINFRGAQITDQQLSHLLPLSNLLRLKLDHTNVSTDGVAQLSVLDKLKYLNLYNTQVDDNLLAILPKFSALEQVYIGESNITHERAIAFSASPEIKLLGIVRPSPSQKLKEES